MARLNTKLRRELIRSRAQFVAVGVTVLLGIAFFEGSLISYYGLGRSYEVTYRRLAFGDVWVRMAAASDNLVRRAARLPNVEAAVGRLVHEVRVSLRDRPVREVMGRLISLPSRRQPEINRVRVVEGRYLSPQARREALVELSFARAHHYRPGEFIYPTIRGEEVRFRIVGLVQSPEYIYAIQSEQYLIPTPDSFGVIFIPQRQAEVLFDMAGAINELCLAAKAGTAHEVAARLESITDRYGGEDPITRDEQPSNKLLMMDLDGYRQMAVIFPLLFLTATVLTTYTLMARMVQAQRTQIGVLRATGFSQRAVLTHYLSLALVPCAIGGLAGIGLGYVFAWFVTRLYVALINVPYIFFEPRLELTLFGLLIAIAAGLAGALAPAHRAARLPPARAMSQEAVGAASLPAGTRLLGKGLPPGLKFPIRNLVRRPLRVAYTVLGVGLGVALIVLSVALLDSVDYAVSTYFEEIQRYDLSAGFDHEQPGRIVSQVRSWPGVWLAEPTLDIPVELERKGITQSTILSGLPPGGQLRRLTTQSGGRIVPGPGEVLVGSLIRTRLNLRDGDWLTLRYTRNRREFSITRTARVGPQITQPIGATVFMRTDDVQRLFANRLGMPLAAASGVLIRADPNSTRRVRERLDRIPAVAAVQSRADTHRQIKELMRFTKAFTGILALFGIGLAFAVVFTTISINILERTRELATLRTLGFGLPRIVWFITLENSLIALGGVLVGLPLGRWLDIYLVTSAQTESMSLAPVIYLRTYLIASFGAAVLALISQIPGLRQLRRLDLAAATKDIAG